MVLVTRRLLLLVQPLLLREQTVLSAHVLLLRAQLLAQHTQRLPLAGQPPQGFRRRAIGLGRRLGSGRRVGAQIQQLLLQRFVLRLQLLVGRPLLRQRPLRFAQVLLGRAQLRRALALHLTRSAQLLGALGVLLRELLQALQLLRHARSVRFSLRAARLPNTRARYAGLRPRQPSSVTCVRERVPSATNSTTRACSSARTSCA